jgi:pilus assembly protein CpaB
MLTIALAVLLAVLGTGLVLAYVHKANTRALDGMQVVTVIVAQKAMPSGTPVGAALHDGTLGSQKLPASAVPADAVPADGVGSITAANAGRVTSTPLQPGQLLLQPMLVTATHATAGIAIPSGMVAVTVQLCVQEAVGGYAIAGSSVALFDTYPVRASDLQRTCDVSHQAQAVSAVGTRIVLPTAEVLSVGAAPTHSVASGISSLSDSAAQGTELVTLAVKQADAERVIKVVETGMPYLALLTPNSHTHPDTAPVQLFRP